MRTYGQIPEDIPKIQYHYPVAGYKNCSQKFSKKYVFVHYYKSFWYINLFFEYFKTKMHQIISM